MPEENFFLRLVREGKIEFTKDGKIIGFNEYAIFLPIRVLNKLFILLKKELGEAKAQEIMKELGRFQIRQAFQRYVKILGWKEVPRNKIWEFGMQVTSSLGLGNYTFKQTNNYYTIIIPKTSFAEEFLLEYGTQVASVDFYIAGIFEEALSRILGKPMICEEVKCYAKGDDCCEFVVKPKEETEEKK
ncbi:MAG: 4-vinyl reductase [Candidatus Aenigmatarchaeota archaeon]